MNKEEIFTKEQIDFVKHCGEHFEVLTGGRGHSKTKEMIQQLQNQVEKLTQENNDLEERVIYQDNLIKQLRGNCKDLGKKNENQREELNRLLKQREKFKTKHCYLKERVDYLERSISRKEETIIELRKEQELDKYKSVIDKAIKRLKGLQAINNGLGATIAPYSLNDVIKILDGSLEEILRSKE